MPTLREQPPGSFGFFEHFAEVDDPDAAFDVAYYRNNDFTTPQVHLKRIPTLLMIAICGDGTRVDKVTVSISALHRFRDIDQLADCLVAMRIPIQKSRRLHPLQGYLLDDPLQIAS
jgi:hypothetical protein